MTQTTDLIKVPFICCETEELLKANGINHVEQIEGLDIASFCDQCMAKPDFDGNNLTKLRNALILLKDFADRNYPVAVPPTSPDFNFQNEMMKVPNVSPYTIDALAEIGILHPNALDVGGPGGIALRAMDIVQRVLSFRIMTAEQMARLWTDVLAICTYQAYELWGVEITPHALVGPYSIGKYVPPASKANANPPSP